MITKYPELLEAVERTLRYCRVKPEERVVVYTDSGRPKDIAETFLAAAVAMGCDALLLQVRSRPHLVHPPAAAVKAMKAADIVFDISTESWLFTQATADILASGTRMLQVRGIDAVRLLERAPTDAIMAKAKVAKALFERGTNVHIRSALGTDLWANYEGRLPVAQDGVVEQPGDWDSLGTAFCNVCPNEESVEGTVVLNGPVTLSGYHPFIIVEPVRLEMKGGSIVKVEGGGEARVFESWLGSRADPNMRRMAHIGFGYDPHCGPPPKPVITGDYGSWEAMNGGVIVAFGANKGLGKMGGENDAKGHSDCALLDADFHIDDGPIIQAGKFVVDGLK